MAPKFKNSTKRSHFFYTLYMKTPHALIILIFLAFFSRTTTGQSLQSFSAGFELSISHIQDSHSKGNIYYKSPDVLLLIVHEPLDQIMFYKNDHLQVYYPQTDELLEFKDSSIKSLAFFQGFRRAIQDRHDATETGFVFHNSHFENDTLYMTYIPPADYQEAEMTMTNVYHENRLHYNYIIDANDNMLAKSEYANYKTIDRLNIPHSVLIQSFDSFGNVAYKEHAYFFEVKINQITDFSKLLPEQFR